MKMDASTLHAMIALFRPFVDAVRSVGGYPAQGTRRNSILSQMRESKPTSYANQIFYNSSCVSSFSVGICLLYFYEKMCAFFVSFLCRIHKCDETPKETIIALDRTEISRRNTIKKCCDHSVV